MSRVRGSDRRALVSAVGGGRTSRDHVVGLGRDIPSSNYERKPCARRSGNLNHDFALPARILEKDRAIAMGFLLCGRGTDNFEGQCLQEGGTLFHLENCPNLCIHKPAVDAELRLSTSPHVCAGGRGHTGNTGADITARYPIISELLHGSRLLPYPIVELIPLNSRSRPTR